jgi:hypothetical protein
MPIPAGAERPSPASRWGDPEHYPWTIGWQPNYRAEARIYATYILQHYPNARIVTRRLRYALQHGAPRLLQGRRT